MSNAKKVLALVLALVVITVFVVPVSAADTASDTDKLTVLKELGLVPDSIKSGDSSKTINRQLIVVLVLDFFGKLDDANAMKDADVNSALRIFKDAKTIQSDKKKAVAYAAKNGICSGTSATTFSPSATGNANFFASCILKLAGFEVKSGSSDSADMLASKGVTAIASSQKSLKQEDVIAILYETLTIKNSAGKTVIQSLIDGKNLTTEQVDKAKKAGLLSDEYSDKMNVLSGIANKDISKIITSKTMEISIENAIYLILALYGRLDEANAMSVKEADEEINKIELSKSVQSPSISLNISANRKKAIAYAIKNEMIILNSSYSKSIEPNLLSAIILYLDDSFNPDFLTVSKAATALKNKGVKSVASIANKRTIQGLDFINIMYEVLSMKNFNNVTLIQTLVDEGKLDEKQMDALKEAGFAISQSTNAASYHDKAEILSSIGQIDITTVIKDQSSVISTEDAIYLVLAILGRMNDVEAMSENEANTEINKITNEVTAFYKTLGITPPLYVTKIKQNIKRKKEMAYALKNGIIDSLGFRTTFMPYARIIKGKAFKPLLLKCFPMNMNFTNSDIIKLKDFPSLDGLDNRKIKGRYFVDIMYEVLLMKNTRGKTLIQSMADEGRLNAAQIAAAEKAGLIEASVPFDVDSVNAKTNTRVDIILKTAAHKIYTNKFVIKDEMNNILAVKEAVLSPDGKLVKLVTASQTVDAKYTLTIDDKSYSFKGLAADDVKPALTSAVSMSATQVKVVFSEDMSDENVLLAANYKIAGLDVLSAVYDANVKNNIILTTSTQAQGSSYRLVVANVTDMAGNVINEENDEYQFNGPPAPSSTPSNQGHGYEIWHP